MADYGFHQGVQTNGPGTPSADTIAARKLKAALEETRENLARVQDLPENSRTRQKAELAHDEVVANIASGGCDVPFPSPYPSYPTVPPVPGWGTTTTLLNPMNGKSMDIYIIWAIVPDEPKAPWAVAAWDSESIAGNEDGWLETLAEAEENYGGRYVRVTKASINYDAVVSAFEPVAI